MQGADPKAVSEQARKRQRDEMGTLGSGNHYLEVQHVAEVFDAAVAAAYGWADYAPTMPDDEILRRLLALNLARAAAWRSNGGGWTSAAN